MKVRFIGDIHGAWNDYCRVINDNLPADQMSIQLGDFGVGFGRREHWDPILNDPDAPNNFFIRGNHDNPNECCKHPRFIPDGTVHSGVFCCGGGLSIDREWRIEGMDWWPGEELSYSELQAVIDKYAILKPDYVATHDAPENIIPYMFPHYIKGQYPSRTRQAFQTMFEIHRPKVWVYGHWHPQGINRYQFDNTSFRCIGINQYEDIEIE